MQTSKCRPHKFGRKAYAGAPVHVPIREAFGFWLSKRLCYIVLQQRPGHFVYFTSTGSSLKVAGIQEILIVTGRVKEWKIIKYLKRSCWNGKGPTVGPQWTSTHQRTIHWTYECMTSENMKPIHIKKTLYWSVTN